MTAGTLLEAVARARDLKRSTERDAAKAHAAFVKALQRARRAHTFSQIADVAGITKEGVRYLVLDADARRAWNGKRSRDTLRNGKEER